MSASGATFVEHITLDNSFKLPTIKFIAGETMQLAFNVFDEETLSGYDFSSYSATFSVANYVSREETVISAGMAVSHNTLSVTLSHAQTLPLSGKYVYQITINNGSTSYEVPGQGIMYVSKSI